MISPGPLSSIDPYLERRGPVFRSLQPQQRVRPSRSTTSAVHRCRPPGGRVAERGRQRRIFLATDLRRARAQAPAGPLPAGGDAPLARAVRDRGAGVRASGFVARITLCAARRRTRGVCSATRSASAAAPSARGGTKSGTQPELDGLRAPPRRLPAGPRSPPPRPPAAPRPCPAAPWPSAAPSRGCGGCGPSAARARRGVTRAPSRPARADRRRGSATWCITATLITRSKLESSNGSSVAEPCTASTSGERSRSTSSIPAEGSIPVIENPSAASRAASTPVPQPTSSPSPGGQCSTTNAARLAR